MWWMHDGWSPWAQTAMVIGMVLFWAVIIGGGIWLARAAGGHARSSPDDARAILDQRLARGEIDIAEYESRREAMARARGADHGSNRGPRNIPS